MRFRNLLVICSLLIVSISAWGIDTTERIFNPRFRTLQILPADDFYGVPVIRLGSEDRLIITFDELGDDFSYLKYRLVHCNADWQPSVLVESEILDGFNEGEITDYAFSNNTYVHYVNYRVEIPNADMSPLASGNYLFQVFEQENPEETLLQTRFSVSENQATVGGELTSRTDKGLNTEWQQLNLRVNTLGMHLRSPYTDVFLVVNQNHRPETTRTIVRPQRMQGQTLIYEHLGDLIFPAGNEFRRFETVRANYPGMGVDSVGFTGRSYMARLIPDGSRVNRPYSYDQTQYGRFKINEYNSTNPDLGADYVLVHFELKHPEVMNGDLYVDGDFARSLSPTAKKMQYNGDRQSYELDLPLKQGSYNYQYVVSPRGKNYPAQPDVIEGNKFETRNEYCVQVWLREPGSRADRLIGTAQLFNK